jgi:hypothetical protein
MNRTHTATSTARTALQWSLLLLLVPALVFVTGCDSNGNGDPVDNEDEEVGRLVEGPVDEDSTEVPVDYNDDGENEVVRVTDVGANGVVPPGQGSKVTWTNDKIWELNGYVFVNPGDTLVIEEGTTVHGRLGGGAEASALIVAAGGVIQADGSPGNPIVFTSVRAADEDLGRTRGLWGGVILLGDAPTNNGRQVAIEGVPDNTGARILYGGSNVDHDVGTFRYVSIRHTGTQLGNGDEIQGLTLGAVGSGSTIEYVESYASNDDGYEWFGGTVNTKYLIAAWAADDSYDIDQGFRGSNQFWLAVQAGDEAGRASEMDGAGDAGATPLARSIVSNATYIGMGPSVSDFSGDANDPFLIHRDDNATSYYNSVFTGGRTNKGIQIEDLDGTVDAADRWDNGALEHVSNTWYNIGPDYDAGAGFEPLVQVTRDDNENATGDRGEAMIANLADYLANNDNELLANSPLESIDRGGNNGEVNSFNPTTSSAVSGATTTPSDFGQRSVGVNDNFVPPSGRGAFASGAQWGDLGWTKLASEGELTQ